MRGILFEFNVLINSNYRRVYIRDTNYTDAIVQLEEQLGTKEYLLLYVDKKGQRHEWRSDRLCNYLRIIFASCDSSTCIFSYF